MSKIRAYNALIGGTTGALDAEESSGMAAGDRAFVIDSSNDVIFYRWDATSTAAESTVAPFDVIRPDDFTTQGVWVRTKSYSTVTGSTVSTFAWDTVPTTAAPAAPVAGHFYWADNNGWDPIGSTYAESYFALYTTGSTYVGVIDGAGNLLFSNITTDLSSTVSTADNTLPSAKAVKNVLPHEVDGSANTTLTVANLTNGIIYNTGQTTADVTLTLINATAGLSGLFTVGTTVANDWKVRASTANKIYAVASSDGSISVGATAGYYGFDATTAVGLSFAVWAFKDSTASYNWMAKCISGTPSTSAP